MVFEWDPEIPSQAAHARDRERGFGLGLASGAAGSPGAAQPRPPFPWERLGSVDKAFGPESHGPAAEPGLRAAFSLEPFVPTLRPFPRPSEERQGRVTDGAAVREGPLPVMTCSHLRRNASEENPGRLPGNPPG